MVMPIRAGSIVALVTPMNVDNSIDYEKLISLLKWHVAEGIQTLLVCISSANF